MSRLSILCAALLVAACGESADPAAPSRVATYPYSRDVSVWSDAATGCEYLIWDGGRSGGITPRLRANGTQVCFTQ